MRSGPVLQCLLLVPPVPQRVCTGERRRCPQMPWLRVHRRRVLLVAVRKISPIIGLAVFMVGVPVLTIIHTGPDNST